MMNSLFVCKYIINIYKIMSIIIIFYFHKTEPQQLNFLVHKNIKVHYLSSIAGARKVKTRDKIKMFESCVDRLWGTVEEPP